MNDFHNMPTYKKGVPCSQWCANHLSHPCEKCHRYAAGLQSGPDVGAVWARLKMLSFTDPIIDAYLKTGHISNWSDEQVMAAMLLKFQEINTRMQAQINRIIEQSPVPISFED